MNTGHGVVPNQSPPPIVCRSLTKKFGKTTVVDDVSFEIAPGTITGFVGANGAGKTTTMRMLLGLVTPTSGEALIAGRSYRELTEPRQQVGAVLDGPGAYPRHTATNHLRILASASGIPRSRVPEVVERVGLAAHSGRKTGQFSLGMKQRLALAAALLADPAVLLLDEPVNGLDPRGILWMREFLRELADEGRTVLVSSHLLSELAEIAQRVIIIDRGRVVEDGTIDELTQGRSLEELYFERAGSLDTEEGQLTGGHHD
jgi:ABC-2 type transport system ATP-binding protein